jgi:type 1 glutamine amidotransferase
MLAQIMKGNTQQVSVGMACVAVWLMVSGLAAAAPLKVLVVTGGHGFEEKPFFKMFNDNTEIAATFAQHTSTNATVFERPDLLSFDVVVLYDIRYTISDEQKAKFLALLKKGVGLVVLHHALVSYQDWPDYERIIGGLYPEAADKRGVVTEKAGYEHDVDIPVTIVARDHPITAGLKDFTLHDEIYWGYRVGSDVTPLITTSHAKSGKPLGWCREEGKARVVYLQLGHGPQAFEDANYRRLLANSMRWSAKR